MWCEIFLSQWSHFLAINPFYTFLTNTVIITSCKNMAGKCDFYEWIFTHHINEKNCMIYMWEWVRWQRRKRNKNSNCILKGKCNNITITINKLEHKLAWNVNSFLFLKFIDERAQKFFCCETIVKMIYAYAYVIMCGRTSNDIRNLSRNL